MDFFIQIPLWFSVQILQGGILVALVARGWHRQFPWFTAYILVQAVSDLVLMPARGRWPYVYYFVYWLAAFISIALTLAVLLEVAEHAWPSGNAPKLKKVLLRGLVPAILMVVLMGLFTSQSRGIDAITSFLLLADGSVRLAIWALALFILFFCQWQGLSERALDFGIVAGFLLFSSLHLLVVNAMSHPTLLRHSTLSAINSGAYLAATLIWLGYAILAPKDSRVGSADAACLA